ncbi:MAG: bifunctional 5,10-methylenetetrahydrofolate dehydrogenase/5,10-methenyltetrahydrofolate cyclohydrolase, partial [Clostridia bacterium]|nr:bifunctional 5,10-methylenetetrahydrofolate dehydrogenase/5,10-methenyltetrahydrofolate cyclohydrolase [Clostridia bacterium]
MILIDGKEVSASIRNEIKQEVEKIHQNGKQIGLAVIIIGEDPASKIYVNNKVKACHETGITSYHYELPEDVSQEEILRLINTLNQNADVNGILVQLPIPKHLDKDVILTAIDPKKDVDGFSAYQSGKTFLGEKSLVSCTPQGIIALLKYYNIEISGKNAVVIGRSNIVGKPAGLLL